MGGAVTWYSVGHVLGGSRCEELIDHCGKFVFMGPELYRRLAAAYRRNHFLVTVIGQTVPIVRIYLALPAGILGLPLRSFLLATAIGTLAGARLSLRSAIYSAAAAGTPLSQALRLVCR